MGLSYGQLFRCLLDRLFPQHAERVHQSLVVNQLSRQKLIVLFLDHQHDSDHFFAKQHYSKSFLEVKKCSTAILIITSGQAFPCFPTCTCIFPLLKKIDSITVSDAVKKGSAKLFCSPKLLLMQLIGRYLRFLPIPVVLRRRQHLNSLGNTRNRQTFQDNKRVWYCPFSQLHWL